MLIGRVKKTPLRPKRSSGAFAPEIAAIAAPSRDRPLCDKKRKAYGNTGVESARR